jgi:hypothetical protein
MISPQSFFAAAGRSVGAPAAALEHEIERVAVLTAAGPAPDKSLNAQPQAHHNEKACYSAHKVPNSV